MFETSMIHAQVHGGERKAGVLTISLVAHGTVIAAVLLAGLHSTSFPDHAPKEMSYPLLPVPVSIPPALGTPDAPQHRAAPAPKAPTAAMPIQPTAPQLIPENVQPAPGPTFTVVSGNVGPDGTSPASGEPRGVPWGSTNGVGVDGPPAAAIEQQPDTPLHVTGDVKAPIVIHRVQPAYPRVALMGRMNGTVVVQCIIDRTGQVRDTRVVRSTFAAFDQPAVDAVRQWVFTPGSLHGRSVDTIFELTVSFRVTP
ncbi:MAG: TonB family protein [Thermoanaerobaculia bacterium]